MHLSYLLQVAGASSNASTRFRNRQHQKRPSVTSFSSSGSPENSLPSYSAESDNACTFTCTQSVNVSVETIAVMMRRINTLEGQVAAGDLQNEAMLNRISMLEDQVAAADLQNEAMMTLTNRVRTLEDQFADLQKKVQS